MQAMAFRTRRVAALCREWRGELRFPIANFRPSSAETKPSDLTARRPPEARPSSASKKPSCLAEALCVLRSANSLRGGGRGGFLGGCDGLQGTAARRAFGLTLSGAVFAPKKKVGGGAGGASASSQSSGAGSGASHVFNIYKAIPEDHKILPDEDYPRWLWTLTEKPKSYGQLAMQFLYGQVFPATTLRCVALGSTLTVSEGTATFSVFCVRFLPSGHRRRHCTRFRPFLPLAQKEQN